eukprot:scaffold30005_cov66-Phaeocystis_antarctica.AAC.2
MDNRKNMYNMRAKTKSRFTETPLATMLTVDARCTTCARRQGLTWDSGLSSTAGHVIGHVIYGRPFANYALTQLPPHISQRTVGPHRWTQWSIGPRRWVQRSIGPRRWIQRSVGPRCQRLAGARVGPGGGALVVVDEEDASTRAAAALLPPGRQRRRRS